MRLLICFVTAIQLLSTAAAADEKPTPQSLTPVASESAKKSTDAPTKTAVSDPIDDELLSMGLWFGKDLAIGTARLNRVKAGLSEKLTETWRADWLGAWQHEVNLVTALPDARRQALFEDLVEAREIDRAVTDITDHSDLDRRISEILSRVQAILDERCPSYLLVLMVRREVRLATGANETARMDGNRVRALRSQILGTWNPFYAADSENLGRCELALGELDDAKKHFTECLDFRSAASGSNSGAYWLTKMNLGILAVREQRYEEAISTLGEVLSQKGWSPKNQAVIHAKCFHNLGIAFGRTKRSLEAEASFDMALGQYRKILPAAHPLILDTLNDQLTFYVDTKQDAKATKLKVDIEALRAADVTKSRQG